jgi:FkbM family methyltransferase
MKRDRLSHSAIKMALMLHKWGATPFIPGRLLRLLPGVNREGPDPGAIRLRPGSTDVQVFKAMFLGLDYDPRWTDAGPTILNIYDRLLGMGMRPLIIDCGANVGFSSLYFSLRFPEAAIVCLEPEKGNFEELSKRQLGPYALCLRAAIASTDGQVNVVDPGTGNWGFRTVIDRDGAEEPVAAYSVGTTVEFGRKWGRVAPFLIKIDIEGFEAELFSRNYEWLDEIPVMIIEVHDRFGGEIPKSRNLWRAVAMSKPRNFFFHGEDIISTLSDWDCDMPSAEGTQNSPADREDCRSQKYSS